MGEGIRNFFLRKLLFQLLWNMYGFDLCQDEWIAVISVLVLNKEKRSSFQGKIIIFLL